MIDKCPVCSKTLDGESPVINNDIFSPWACKHKCGKYMIEYLSLFGCRTKIYNENSKQLIYMMDDIDLITEERLEKILLLV
jgi:hypothetical protein